MARLHLLALSLLVLAISPVFAHGGGGGRGGRGGGGGFGGGLGDHASPVLPTGLSGNITGRMGAPMANCSASNAGTRGGLMLAIFKDESSDPAVYHVYYEAHIHEYSGTAPDSLAIVKGAACESAATSLLTLPATSWETDTHQGRNGETHTAQRVNGTVEGADSTVIEELLANVPNATVDSTAGVFGRTMDGAKDMRGRLPGGRKLLAVVGIVSSGKPVRDFAAKQKQRAQNMRAKVKAALVGASSETAAASGYAVLATESTGGVSWGGALNGKPPHGKRGGGRGGRGH